MKNIALYILLLVSNLSFGQFGQPIVIDSVNVALIKNINIIDLDNDNQKDIVVSYLFDSICWYKNVNLTFTKMPAILDSMYYPVYVDHADIDGNGFEDLLVSNNSNLAKIHLLKNINGGTVWDETIIDDNIPAAVSRSMFADLDNDGDLDIISCHDLEVAIYTQNSGIFSNRITVADGNEFYNMVVKDFDNDGFIDFVIHSAFGVQLFTNNHNLTFTPNILSNELHGLLETCDIDNDGDFDIFYPDISVFSDIKTFKNDGVGNFSQFQSAYYYVGSVQNPSLKFLSLDSDSFPDALYTPIVSQGIYYKTNDGTGNLSTSVLIDSTYQYSYIAGDDLDNDSDNDIVWFANSLFGIKRLGIMKNQLVSLNLSEVHNPDFKLFPNPASDYLYIQNQQSSKSITIQIVDIHGRIVYKNNNVSGPIYTSNWSDGLYFIQINGMTYKVIKCKAD